MQVAEIPKEFLTWAKRRETPAARRTYALAQQLRRAEVPWPRVIARIVWVLRDVVKGTWAAAGRAAWDQPLFRSRCAIAGPGLRLDGGIPMVVGPVRLEIGANVLLNGKTTFASGFGGHAPTIVIGDGTSIGCRVQISASARVELGRFVRVAEGCFIADNPGHPIDALRRRTTGVTPDQVRPVAIGDDVWLGTRVVVMPGVTIGARTIVGAGSVVTADLPADVVAAGSPARIVRRLDPSDTEGR